MNQEKLEDQKSAKNRCERNRKFDTRSNHHERAINASKYIGD